MFQPCAPLFFPLGLRPTAATQSQTMSTLPGSFGTCVQSSVATETASDAANPPLGAGWFYLITARNVLTEEGTKGYRSNGIERTNPAPCP